MKILSDDAIEKAKAEAERLSWTHKAHPSFEKEKYLLGEAQKDTMRQVRKELIRVLKGMPSADNKTVAVVLAVLRSMRQELKEIKNGN